MYYATFKEKIKQISTILLFVFCLLLHEQFIEYASAATTVNEVQPYSYSYGHPDALLFTIKGMYTPPVAGQLPDFDNIPLHNVWEDPDWETPLVTSIYNNPYSYANNLEHYLPCLGEAVNGNAKAMLALAMLYYSWDYIIREKYPELPAYMHNREFWINWALRLTDPGWVELRLGDLSQRWVNTSNLHYLRAAEFGNAEAMHNYYTRTGEREDFLYRSAALGYPRAAIDLAEKLEKQESAQGRELAQRYIWLAALNGDEWGLLHTSYFFYNGEFGKTKRCENGYLFAVLAERYSPDFSEDSLSRVDNVCMLTEEKRKEVEAEADVWQAMMSERKEPYLEYARKKRQPVLAEFSKKLEPAGKALTAMQIYSLQKVEKKSMVMPESFGAIVAPASTPAWHLGFYSEAAIAAKSSDSTLPILQKLSANSIFTSSTKYIPAFYFAIIGCFALGLMFLIFSSIKRKQSRK